MNTAVKDAPRGLEESMKTLGEAAKAAAQACNGLVQALPERQSKKQIARAKREERKKNSNFPFSKPAVHRFVVDREFLSTPGEEVSLKEASEIIQQLHTELSKHNKAARKPLKLDEIKRGVRRPPIGVGLAAHQIGIQKRVCIIHLPKLKLALVNPKIIGYSKVRIPIEEGCLSIPNETKMVFRHHQITLIADNLPEPITVGNNDVTKLTTETLMQVACCQHEISHTYGLIIDHFQTEDYPTPDNWHRWDEASQEILLTKKAEESNE